VSVRASPWWILVTASAVVLIAATVLMGAWWAASSQTRVATSRVVGTLSAIELDLDEAAVEIVGGGGGAVGLRRTETYAFGRRPAETRGVAAGVLRLRSRCPDTVLGTCRMAYRITVPDNVQVNVRTTSGPVAVSRLNGSSRIVTGSGRIRVDAFCGFSLSATSGSGDVLASTECSPDRVELRSGSGDVRAVVPRGRYRVDASSNFGAERVRGLSVADDASFAVQAISNGGDVTVEGDR